jgi:glyoxylase-like metal-dependent hydrolase (beta-lactamase superfamily II)
LYLPTSEHFRLEEVGKGILAAIIIATETTYDEFINRLQPEMTALSQDSSGLNEWLDGLRQQLSQTDDAAQQKILSDRIIRQEKLLAALPDLIPTPPTQTFKEKITFHGTKRTAVLQSFGACHSASDSVLILPDDSIIFMGDLLFVQCQPYYDTWPSDMFEYNLRAWVEKLSPAQESEPD